MFTICSVNAQGIPNYYTGRAGDGWVSSVETEAFVYDTREGAAHRAENFNLMTPVHGLNFTLVGIEV